MTVKARMKKALARKPKNRAPQHLPLRPLPLPTVERLTVAPADLQWLDIIVETHEKVQTVTARADGYVDVTVDTHDSVMHVPVMSEDDEGKPVPTTFVIDRMIPEAG